MNKIIVIANPIAGQKNRFDSALKILKIRLEKQNYGYNIYSRVEDIPKKETSGPIDRVIILGGDGTLSFAANFLYHRKCIVPIAIIPVGSGNIFAQSIGVPLSLNKSINAALGKKTKNVPYGILNGKKVFLMGVSTGVHANLMKETPRWSKKMIGTAAYYLRLPLHLTNIKRHDYQITMPGKKTISIKASAVFILNGLPRLPQEPFKSMDAFKPVFYVLILEIAKPLEIIKTFSTIFLTGKMPRNGVLFYKAKEVNLKTNGAPLNLDGEEIESKNLTVKISKNYFRIFLP